MNTIDVRFEVDVEEVMSDQEVQEWLEFNLHARGNMHNSNPMSDLDIEAKSFSVDFTKHY